MDRRSFLQIAAIFAIVAACARRIDIVPTGTVDDLDRFPLSFPFAFSPPDHPTATATATITRTPTITPTGTATSTPTNTPTATATPNREHLPLMIKD